MSAKFRYWALAGLLGAGVGISVSLPAAQSQGESERAQPHRLFAFEGQGSRLGVMVRDLDASVTTSGSAAGVVIGEVDPDSPASKAGLRVDDVVIEYDGERVRSARQFSRLVQETPEGRAVPVVVLRGGTRQALTARPEPPDSWWSGRVDLDGDGLRREVERGLRDLDALPEFRLEPPVRGFGFPDGPGGLLGRRAGTGRLGVTVASVSGQLADYFGAASGGALITNVRAKSPAEAAGLKAGDVVTSLDGTPVDSAEALARAIADSSSTEVTIGYLRDRIAGSATATLEPRAGTGGSRTPKRPLRPATFLRPA